MTFFDQYSFKQKNYALVVLTVLLIAASYKRAFKNTIETVQYRKELNEKIIFSKNAINEIKGIQTQIVYYNKLLGKENVTIEKVQQGFLNFLAINNTDLIVYQIDEVLTFQHPDFSINTHKIILKGNFNQTLRFINKLEKHFDLAKLINVSFEFKKYNSDEKEELYTTLLLQNYEQGTKKIYN
jgi:hypothetical protein